MDINGAIKEFDRIAANLTKLQKLWKDISDLIPSGVHFFPESQEKYDELCRSFADIWAVMPALSGFKPDIAFYDLNQIARDRLNAEEVGEIEFSVYINEKLQEPKVHLEAYGYSFQKKRREFIKNNVAPLIESINVWLNNFDSTQYQDSDGYNNKTIPDEIVAPLNESFKAIDVLLGGQTRPPRWGDMSRHLGFHQLQDILDIQRLDWPPIVAAIEAIIYSEYDALPLETKDIDEIIKKSSQGTIITKLKWDSLGPDMFERLIFNIVSVTKGYENTKWLTTTNASDRGRDLSTVRMIHDKLTGQISQRIILQCKHWLSKSISISDISTLKEQMKLWEPPKVDVCIVVTSGRFTTDAVDYIERHNQGDSALKIEMWPESHLESILASHPELVGEYNLR